ncbi:hypothetical protein PY310_17150 [Pseudarthrobacter sp. H3Y2-7]|uniref:hypothetical protein n=1 Tax=Pseudarthrobacter naphthalenicus TaxID=3031328 RepID=UPI0023B06152|nr:hypothetical protein [Pseudarthrobacter sp. H3Y2-7]MDE8670308.1 hypothetical protein [Pseudarthrobacter sp. H3Y2-7]
MSLPVQPSPRKRRRDGTDNGPARKKRIALLAVAATVALILVAVAALLFLPTRQNPSATPGSAAATAAPTASVAPTPTPEKVLPPAPAVTYYQQAGPPNGSPLTAIEPLSIKVSAEKMGTSLPDGIVGLSLEATDLADASLRGDNPEIVARLQGLGKPLLRFGGNSVDRRFFWTSSGEAIPGNLTGDKAHPVKAVTPADLVRVNTLLEAADATISLTVDLGHYDPARAADMVKYAREAFGKRLVSLTVGNEPNGFPLSGVRDKRWGINDYLRELKAYAEAIFVVAPDLPLLGPGAYEQSWWEPFLRTDLPQKRILSLHNYPLHVCDSTAGDRSPTLTNLMSSALHDATADYQTAALTLARKYNVDTWMPETGISACSGSNPTTKVHASALWAVDYTLHAAQLGIQKLGFHSSLMTCQGGPPMSAICAGGPYLKPNGTYSERSNYFGMSFAAELGAGEFLRLQASGGGLTYAYALQNANGSTTVIVVNENDPTEAAQTRVTLELPGKALTGTMTQLTGPSFGAEDQTKIDGAFTAPAPVAERATVEGFNYGSKTQTFKLTAGTATVLNFTY